MGRCYKVELVGGLVVCCTDNSTRSSLEEGKLNWRTIEQGDAGRLVVLGSG